VSNRIGHNKVTLFWLPLEGAHCSLYTHDSNFHACGLFKTFPKLSGNEDEEEKYWNYSTCELHENRRFIKRDKKVKKKSALSNIDTDHSAFYTNSNNIVNPQMFSFLKNPPMWDFEIQVENYIFRVHSRILISQSQFFRNLLRISDKKSNGQTKDSKNLKSSDRNGRFIHLTRWEAPFMTPEEVEALLVFIYCHSWPKSVMDKKGRLSQRFLLALEDFGVSLKTFKSTDINRRSENISCEIFDGSRVQKYLDSDHVSIQMRQRQTPVNGMGDFQPVSILSDNLQNDIFSMDHEENTWPGKVSGLKIRATIFTSATEMKLNNILRE